MEILTQLFDRMDERRHLPNYQLERRADLLFSLYLPQALEAKLGFPVRADLVPEFPVRIGTIYPRIPINKSFKIDYLALSTSGDHAVFVELKTDGHSRRAKQDEYLAAARSVGLSALLDGLLTIFRATQAKRKYFHLLRHLSRLGLLDIPDKMCDIMNGADLRGCTEASREIRVTCRASAHSIIYVQPAGTGSEIISFDDFKAVVEQHSDALSKRFAESLAKWARVEAGEVAPLT